MFLRTNSKTPLTLVYFLLILLSAAGLGRAQTSQPAANLSQAEIDRIVSTFSRKENEFRKALNEYAFKRDAILQSIGMGGQVTGEYHRVSTFTFDDQGTRYEKISFFPMSSFAGEITKEDLEDLGGVGPFALDPSKMDRYNFRYVGKEKIDELSLYVFDVTPKVMPDPKKTKERLFSGRIWVDDQDLQIVKTKGKGVPESKRNKFPVVETYREQIDGKYWFPTYSYADEELVFDSGDVLHLRMKVKYSDFEFARAKVKIIEVDDPDAPKKETKPATNPPRKP
jgi:CRISPR/Cas system-associated endoribonuclease Cas2